MNHAHLVGVLCGVLAVIAAAYFALLAARPDPLARVLLSRGYADRGWNPQRLALRIRALGLAGVVLAGAAIVLAVKVFVG